MASNGKNSQSNSSNPRGDDPEQIAVERVQELTWALLDEQISEDEVSLLDTLLLTGDSARGRYVECVQLHTDLLTHFANENETTCKSGEKSPVLSFLNVGPLGVEAPAPRPTE